MTWTDDVLAYSAKVLYESGLVNSKEQWDMFCEEVCDAVERYFSQLVENDPFGYDFYDLERVDLDLDNLPEPMDAPDFPHGGE